jgi:hypothetical protein
MIFSQKMSGGSGSPSRRHNTHSAQTGSVSSVADVAKSQKRATDFPHKPAVTEVRALETGKARKRCRVQFRPARKVARKCSVENAGLLREREFVRRDNFKFHLC